MSKFYNYNSFIVTYNIDNYSNLKIFKDNLKLIFITSHFKHQIDVLLYLLKNSNQINVLQLFNLQNTLFILIYSLIYKTINRKGIIYVKMDADENTFSLIMKQRFGKKPAQKFMIKYLIDLISVETLTIYDKLINEKIISIDKLLHLPNGIDDDLILKKSKLIKKDYILIAGRLGTKQKATEVILESFAKIKELETGS